MTFMQLFGAALALGACTQAPAVGNLAEVSVIDRSDGRRLPVVWHGGTAYVVGTPGNEYRISVRNREGGEVLAVMSVDGVKAEDIKAPPSASWVLQSDRGITYDTEVPRGSKVVEGNWWGADYRGPPLVSFEKKIADGLKLALKEIIIPTKANRFLFILAPLLALAPALAAWAVIPFDDGMILSNIDAGLLYILALTSMSVYGIIIAGWASNSKYAFLGALRSAAADCGHGVDDVEQIIFGYALEEFHGFN